VPRLQYIKEIIYKNHDLIYVGDKDGWTPLHYVAAAYTSNGHKPSEVAKQWYNDKVRNIRNALTIMKMLLDAGADPDAKDNDEKNPFFYNDACFKTENSRKVLLREAMKIKALNNEQDDDTVEVLIEQRLDKAQDLSSESIVSVVQASSTTYDPEKTSQQTTDTEDKQVIGSRLELDVVNLENHANDKLTILHKAILISNRPSLQSIKAIIDENRDLINHGLINAVDKDGWTPLHYVAAAYTSSGHKPSEVAKQWYNYKVRNIKNARHIMEMLLQAGADPDAKDNYGQNPLFYNNACFRAESPRKKLLRKAMAKMSLRTAVNGQDVVTSKSTDNPEVAANNVGDMQKNN
jgi:ankyrin repeat protein